MTHLPINLDDLRALIAAGEDSTLQFKADITNADSLAAEMAAMVNGKGAGASCWALPTTMISWVIKVISRVTLTREMTLRIGYFAQAFVLQYLI